MRFFGIVALAIALLQRQGRITYGALKRGFELDDAALEDLRRELIFRGLACDEADEGLVWIGGVPSPVAATADAVMRLSPALAPLSPLVMDDGSTGMPVSARHAPEAERRHLTVLFCDLVDSTHLSRQLDPEDYRAVVRAYQAAAAAVIQRFAGYMAQYLGDGLLVYFGYPHAHEDEAQRAVQASLELVEAMAPLNTRLESQYEVRVAVRVGLHTGLVVIGEMGGGNRQEGPSGPAPTQSRQQLAMGDTPNIAARLQGLAAPNTVVLSAVTALLVQEAFALEERGLHHFKGVAEPMAVFRVLAPQESPDNEEEAGPARVPFLVGRDEEVGLLLRRWEQSKEGRGQVVLLSGEAGIGKSALVQTLREHVRRDGCARLTFRCSPYHTSSALYPVITHFQRLLRWDHDEAPEARLVKLERLLDASRQPLAEVVPLLAALLAVPLPEGSYAALTLTPQQQRQQTLDALVAWLLAEAEQQPVLAVYEDLHWADPSTLELLGALLEQVPTVPMLTVLTFRPVFVPSWPTRSHLTPITLNRLERPQVEALITHLTGGKALPAEVVAHIVAKTDGVPLFVEELTKMLLESDLLQEDTQHYVLTGPLSAVTIPATLQDSLMARLDRLGAARDVAQLGAVVGREFAYDVLEAITPLDEATLQARLAQLVEAELLYQRGRPPHARYVFKHALIQEAAYASLLKSTRQQVHQQIAQVLEARFPLLVETRPELVAQHYTVAGCTEQAVSYWQRAGQQASDRSAHLEAISHVTTGIELLKTLPETPERIKQSLTLHLALGAALLVTKGHAAPEVEHAYTQARALCQQVGEPPELVPVLFGLWRFYVARPQLHTARELGETLLRLAQRTDDPTPAVLAHYTLGWTWFCLGALPTARTHLEAGITRYTPDQRRATGFRIGQDPGVACRAYSAMTLWLLGYPAQALVCLHEALALAHALSHPYSLAFAQSMAAWVAQVRRDVPAVHAHAEACIALATPQGFPLWAASGTILRGWALAMQAQDKEGMAQIRQGIAARRADQGALHIPYYCTMLADVCDHLGYLADGLQALAEAHPLVEQHEDRWWEAEVCRLWGVLLLWQPETPQAEAEAWLQCALDVARRQEAKSLELRAAMSLSRLWQQQGKRTEAQALLAPIYGWFTEGFDTADLQEAKALLQELT
jgi:class 3 adenylate cyclase/predicted ATPase